MMATVVLCAGKMDLDRYFCHLYGELKRNTAVARERGEAWRGTSKGNLDAQKDLPFPEAQGHNQML